MSDINVTNLLDTAFILIIALMLVAPSLTNGLKLDLPQSASAPPLKSDMEKTILVSVEAKKSADETEHILVDSKRVTPEELLTRVQEAKAKNPDVTVQVEADKGCTYGAIFSVLDAIKQAGVDNVDLSSVPPISTEPEKKQEETK